MSAIDGSTRFAARAGHRFVMSAVLAIVVLAAGCKSEKESSAPAAAATGAPATPVTQSSWAPDALEELLAPIALYPDALLGQILAASVNSQEVLDAGNWLLENQNLQGDALDKAAKDADFGPAMLSLVHFPQVVDMMCRELDWTKQLGAAFTSDQKAVLDAVQRLRAQAVDVGSLKTTPEQTVEEKTENGQTFVEVKPTNPEVVYVPQYSPQAVYTAPPPAATSTTTVVEDDDDDNSALAGLLLFGAGMAVGAAINNSYCYPSWGYGAVYMGPRPFYPPAYAYRPMYPAYRPAGGYYPPAGYRNSYNNVNVNRGGNNITINNNNYYNRFDKNQNLRGGRSDSPIKNTKHAGTRDTNRPTAGTSDRARAGTSDKARSGQTARAGTNDWKGKSNYAGGKGGGVSQRPAGGSARAAGADRGYGGSNRYAGADRASQPSASTRPSTGTRPSTSARPSASTRPSAGGSASGISGGAARSSSQPSVSPRTESRGTTRASSGAATRASSGAATRESAMSGASRSGSGSFDRASSARGHASTGGSASRVSSSGGGGGRRGR